jgi:hypothetical protein
MASASGLMGDLTMANRQVGNHVRRIGEALKGMARGRRVRQADAAWELREEEVSYNAHFGGENTVRPHACYLP